jgi:methyl-accepting chemotaxis protein
LIKVPRRRVDGSKDRYRHGPKAQTTVSPPQDILDLEARARRKLALLYVGSILVTITVLLGRGMIVQLSRPEVLNADTIAALILAPPLIYMAYRVVGRGFRRTQEATHSPDLKVKEEAITAALALPARGTFAYICLWVVGLPGAFLITLLFVEPNTLEVSSFITDLIGMIPVVGFPIYAVVEHQTRPLLRTLFEQTAAMGSEDRVLPGQFSIAKRVSIAMGSLVFATTMFLQGKQIANIFGANAPYDDLTKILVAQIPVFIMMTVIVGTSLVVSLRGSIEEVVHAVNAAADGDLRRRAAVTTTDELGALMLDVDRMLAQQAHLISSSATVANELTLSAAQVADGSEQSAEGVGEIAHSMQEVVSGAQVQFDQIAVARAAAEDLSIAIEAARAQTARATTASADARQLAVDGSATAIEAREAMEQTQETINNASAAVARLGGDTDDIDSIVGTIVAIADQTNLLALNAAIEAARAGDMGRGFAVVAEEVRQLASESNDAASEITHLIRKIQRTVNETVDAVSSGSEDVTHSAAIVGSAGDKFSGIAEVLSAIDDNVNEVDTRTIDVARATEAVSAAVDEILTVTESVAALAEQTSASTEEASASSEEITASAGNLRSMASELEKQISAFSY